MVKEGRKEERDTSQKRKEGRSKERSHKKPGKDDRLKQGPDVTQ